MDQLKRFIRNLAIRFELFTAGWVVPRHAWDLIDRGKLEEANIELQKIIDFWGSDEPEVARALNLIRFLEK